MSIGRSILEAPGWTPPDQRFHREAADFLRYARAFGLDPKRLGQQFTQNGEVFTVVGLRARARMRVVIATNANGVAYRFAATDVLQGAPR